MPDADPRTPAPSPAEGPAPGGPALEAGQTARPARGLKYAAAVLLVAMVAAGLWLAGGSGAKLQDTEHRTGPILEAEGRIYLVMAAGRKEMDRQAIRQAEEALRDAESRLSASREDSEIHRLNAAKAGRPVPLSAPALEALRTARRLHADTRGAFDVTVLPISLLWTQAAKDARVPTPADLAAARAASAWDQIEIREGGAIKRSDSAGVDLGGLARALAADRAAETLQALGAEGGAVILGGSLRCFGRRADRAAWNVDVPDPFDAQGGKPLMTLTIGEGAVSTVAPYRLYEVINGKSYGRILNPTSGWPVSAAASATAVAPTCAQAEGWAAALCVLGEGGLGQLPPGVEGMILSGTPRAHQVRVSEGFSRYRPAQQKGK